MSLIQKKKTNDVDNMFIGFLTESKMNRAVIHFGGI